MRLRTVGDALRGSISWFVVDDELNTEPNPHAPKAQQRRYIRNAATAFDARQGGLGHPRALRDDLLRQASALADLTQLVSELQVTARLLVFGVSGARPSSDLFGLADAIVGSA